MTFDPHTSLHRLLTSVPVTEWTVQMRMGLDWYDGVREGVCVLHNPNCTIRLKETGWSHGQRLYRVYSFPASVVETIKSALTPEEWAEETEHSCDKEMEIFSFLSLLMRSVTRR